MNVLSKITIVGGLAFAATIGPAKSAQPFGAGGGNHSPGTTVVDSAGKVVGYLVTGNYLDIGLGKNILEQSVNGNFFNFQFSPVAGFGPSSIGNTIILYTSTDCSTPPYLQVSVFPAQTYTVADATQPPQIATNVPLYAAATLYFPGTPSSQRIAAFNNPYASPPVPCTAMLSSPTIFAGPLQSVHVSFTPPFALK